MELKHFNFTIDDEKLEEIEKVLEKRNLSKESLEDALRNSSISFITENSSRVFSHHLVESFLSYTQQSQRYVEIKDIEKGFVVPQEIMQLGENKRYVKLQKKGFELYKRMTVLKDGVKKAKRNSDYVHGIPIEDGRYGITIAAKTNVKTTMSASDIFELIKANARFQSNETGYFYGRLIGGVSEVSESLAEGIMKAERRDLSEYEDQKRIKNVMLSQIEDEVQLMQFISNPVLQAALGAATSTNAEPPSQILKKWDKEGKTIENSVGLVRRVLGIGHESIAEHARFTFGLQISLTAYHQLIRHRLPDHEREDFEDLAARNYGFELPDSINKSKFRSEFFDYISELKLEGNRLANKDELGRTAAVYYLPNAAIMNALLTTNARDFNTIFGERICSRAQWDIRSKATKMIDTLISYAKPLFPSIGPGCTKGDCPEGPLSCHMENSMRRKYGDHRK